MFRAKLNAAHPPSEICIPIVAYIYRFICQAIRLNDLGIINLIIFLNAFVLTFSCGLNLYLVPIVSTTLIAQCSVAPIRTPVAAEYIPIDSFSITTPIIMPRLYRIGDIAYARKCLYVMSMLPSVLLIANNIADGSISLVMFIMSFFDCIDVSEKSPFTIGSISMNANIASNVIRMVALVSIVFAISRASFSSFARCSENTGMKAAISAPAMNRLNNMSGIMNEAVYASVAWLAPKLNAIVLSLSNPTM